MSFGGVINIDIRYVGYGRVNRDAVSAPQRPDTVKNEETVPRIVRIDLIRGLSADQVAAARSNHGENKLSEKKRRGFIAQFFTNFNDPIIRILLGALVINVAFMMRDINWLETGGIAVAILIATFVSTVSEYGSQLAFDKLCRDEGGTLYRVLRDGTLTDVPPEDIVVGDVVSVAAGDIIPADGVMTGGAVSCSQAALTGESAEMKKRPDEVFIKNTSSGSFNTSKISWSASDASQLFRGTSVISGEGSFAVLRVGDDTLIGGVASGLQEDSRPSPLKERLGGLAKSISVLGYIFALLIAAAYLFNVFFIDSGMSLDAARAKMCDGRFVASEVISAVTVAVSVIVVAVPEGLPMMITVVLSSNMKRMLKSGVLVRRMVGIETAGGVGVLFTDKTGTLTCGKLAVTDVWSRDFDLSPPVQLKRCPELLRQMTISDGALYNGHGNSTDRALAAFLPRRQTDISTVVDKIPFDSNNKYAAALVRCDGKMFTVMRGAPEKILTHAEYYLSGDGTSVYMSADARADIENRWYREASAGNRIIACATGDADTFAELKHGVARGLTLVAMVTVGDRVRNDVPQSVAECRTAGIQVIMITGDNELTAKAIAEKTGILSSKKDVILTGEKLSAIDDEALKNLFPHLRVVARALPSDKIRLVRVAQSMGLVTGMTGDGINDAPALRGADVGFAMGSGTEVAKEAGDIIITDDSFASITKSVLFGRTIFKSIRKFIVFQLTMNLSAMGVSLIGPFIGIEHPVTVIQMLWVNIIMDTLGGLAFAGEAPLARYMKSKPVPRSEPILSGAMLSQIFITGLFTLALCIWFLKSPFMHTVFSRGGETYYLTVFFALFIFCGIFNSFNARTTRLRLFANLSKNKPFIFIIALVATVQTTLIYFGGEMFRTVPLSAHELCLVFLIAMSVVPADILRKLIRKLRRGNEDGAK